MTTTMVAITSTATATHQDNDYTRHSGGGGAGGGVGGQSKTHVYVVDCYGEISPIYSRLALKALLSALYIRHGTAARFALSALTRLLRDTDFFHRDLDYLPEPGSLTMFDLTLEAICDRYEIGCSDEDLDPLLEFLNLTAAYAGRTLTLHSQQRVFRTAVFLSNHLATGLPPYSDASMPAVFDYDDTQHDDFAVESTTEEGALTAFGLLRQLVSCCLSPVEQVPIANLIPEYGTGASASEEEDVSVRTGEGIVGDEGGERLFDKEGDISAGIQASCCEPLSPIPFCAGTTTTTAGAGTGTGAGTVVNGNCSPPHQSGPISTGSNPLATCSPLVNSPAATAVRDVLYCIVEEIIDSVVVARHTEVVCLGISRQSASIVSQSFWQEINTHAGSLFGDHAYRSTFAVLSGICKQCWHGVRTHKENGAPISRDLAGKLVALDCLEYFCTFAGESVRMSKVIGYQIRRVVIPCLFYNMAFAFFDHRIFTRLLRIITALWKRWRRHIRIEFAIICEQIIFKVMRASVVQTRPVFKRIVIHEVVRWFDQPHMLVETFVNYDMDRKFVSHWNTFSYFVSTLCALGRRLVFSNTAAAAGASANAATACGAPVVGIEGEDGGGAGGGGPLGTGRAGSSSGTKGLIEDGVTIRDVHRQALEEVAHMAKTLMDASGHAYLIMQDSTFRNKSLGMEGGWAEDDDGGGGSREHSMNIASGGAAAAAAPEDGSPGNHTADTSVESRSHIVHDDSASQGSGGSHSTAHATSADAASAAAAGAVTGAPSSSRGGAEDSSSVARNRSDSSNYDSTHTSAPASVAVAPADGSSGSATNTPMASGGRKRVGSVRMRRAAHQESEALIRQAIDIYRAKSSLKKAVDFLVSKDFMPNTAQEVANFLRLYKNSFDAEAIGEFLGEGGRTPEEELYWNQVRFRYTKAVAFKDMNIESAFRLYLTGCGFRLPGEGQKVDRFVEAFVRVFWQDNSGTEHCPFQYPDTVHRVAYAILMLNTDLHRVNLDKKKKFSRMTKDGFLSMLRGADEGSDIDRTYLSNIYDNIAAHPIELEIKTGGAAATAADFSTSSNSNTGGQCSASNVGSGGSSSSKHLAPDNPILYTAHGVPPEVRAAEEKKFVLELSRSLRDSEDLLRSLSTHTFRFFVTNVDTKISLDLVSFMYESVWYHFHSTAEALLYAPSSSVEVKNASLDILMYSLTSAIFLDLQEERVTLANLLLKFQQLCEALPHFNNRRQQPGSGSGAAGRGSGGGGGARSSGYDDALTTPWESWHPDVLNTTSTNALDTIAKLHHLFIYIKDLVQEGMTYEVTLLVAARFEKKAKVLEKNTFFVRQGDMIKISRGGRPTTYRFFLFSDHLIYAHLSRNEYRVHEQLPLNALALSDIDDDPSDSSFYIAHPIKSFVVVTESPQASYARLGLLDNKSLGLAPYFTSPPVFSLVFMLSFCFHAHFFSPPPPPPPSETARTRTCTNDLRLPY